MRYSFKHVGVTFKINKYFLMTLIDFQNCLKIKIFGNYVFNFKLKKMPPIVKKFPQLKIHFQIPLTHLPPFPPNLRKNAPN